MKTLKDLNIDNKKVIIRCDLNVPIEDNKITDNTRIIKSLKTINYALERASRVIILSHLGRIKTEEDKAKNSLRIVSEELSKELNQNVYFCTWEEDIENAINNNKIVLLENTRYFDLDNKKESNCDLELSKYLSSFGDVFINDAFGTAHRENASNVGISKYLDSCNGFLIEEEINNLKKLDNPERPFTVIVGDKKVSDKIKLIEKLITKVDYLLVGGAMVYTFLKSEGKEIGNSFLEEDYIDYCSKLLSEYKDKIILIEDNFIDINKCIDIDNMSSDSVGYDIGIKSVERFKEIINKSNTIFFNGSLGFVEGGYTYGTKNILEALNKDNKLVVIGGGDTVSACNELLSNNNFVISTGGGASLEYLQGNKLPGIIEE